MAFYIFLIIILGLSIGSFLNVFIWRFDKSESFYNGRSKCPHCKHKLSWRDLVPIASFILLKGRCRYCNKEISPWYPVIEAATSILILIFILKHGFIGSLSDIYYLVFLLGFVCLFFFDLRYYILPDKVVIPLGAIAILYALFLTPMASLNLLTTGLVLGAIFAILYLVSKGRWMGFGDVKLIAVIGLFFGYPIGFFVIIFSIWAAALTGIGLLILGKAKLKTPLPFGTFLAGVSIAFILLQNEIQILQNYL